VKAVKTKNGSAHIEVGGPPGTAGKKREKSFRLLDLKTELGGEAPIKGAARGCIGSNGSCRHQTGVGGNRLQ